MKNATHHPSCPWWVGKACDCQSQEPAMTEQMNHRAAIEWATEFTDPATAVQRTQAIVLMRMSGHSATADAMEEAVLISRCYLASVKAAWPGASPQYADAPMVYRSANDNSWGHEFYSGHDEPWAAWCSKANKFERDYPGLKVDEPWLVTVMEGMK